MLNHQSWIALPGTMPSDQSVVVTTNRLSFGVYDADDSNESEQEQACGTTATVCLVRQDRVVVANVGDSRAVLSRHGTAVDLSTEHRSDLNQSILCPWGQ